MELFVATHSANFLDASNRQNVYVVSKGGSGGSTIDQLAEMIC
jgi:hypothetical protein